MLSRTASNLFWMARYAERAENTARIVHAVIFFNLMRGSISTVNQLTAPLDITGTREMFSKHYDELNMANILKFFITDMDNPSSIKNAITNVRNNASAVRGCITDDVWESINTSSVSLIKALDTWDGTGYDMIMLRIVEFYHVFLGSVYSTMDRDDSYLFIKAGMAIERSDNTARILDVQYQGNTPMTDSIAKYLYWTGILRVLSADDSFKRQYGDQITIDNLLDMLVLSPSLPRSLLSSVNELNETMNGIKSHYGRGAKKLAAELYASLRFSTSDDIIKQGVDEFLTDFLRKINRVAGEFSHSFLEAA